MKKMRKQYAEIVKNLRKLADSIEKASAEVEDNHSKEDSIVAPATSKEKRPTLEEVRSKLAALTQAGKQAEVKQLITDLGVVKLSDVPKEKYPQLLETARKL